MAATFMPKTFLIWFSTNNSLFFILKSKMVILNVECYSNKAIYYCSLFWLGFFIGCPTCKYFELISSWRNSIFERLVIFMPLFSRFLNFRFLEIHLYFQCLKVLCLSDLVLKLSFYVPSVSFSGTYLHHLDSTFSIGSSCIISQLPILSS